MTAISCFSSACAADRAAPAAAAQKTFLDRCVETIDPKVASRLSLRSTMWNVAAVASLVAFTAISMLAFVATNLFAPVYVPITGISILLLLGLAKQGYEKLVSKADTASEKANQLKKINEKFHALDKASVQDIQHGLMQRGINWCTIPGMFQKPDDLLKLKPLMARQDYWSDYCGKLEEKKQAKLAEIAELVNHGDSIEPTEKIFNKRREVLFIEQAQLQTKVNAAFINAVMRRPTFTGDEDAVYRIPHILPEQRIMCDAFGDRKGREFLIFRNDVMPAFTTDDVKRLSVAEMGERISYAM